MVKVSRWPVSDDDWRKFLDDFWSAVTLLENKNEVNQFFWDILTRTERQMLAKRFQIALLLAQEYDYQSIKRFVKVTDSTIANVNRLLREGKGLKQIAQKTIFLKEKKLSSAEKPIRHPFPGEKIPLQLIQKTTQTLRRIKRRRSF